MWNKFEIHEAWGLRKDLRAKALENSKLIEVQEQKEHPDSEQRRNKEAEKWLGKYVAY